MKKLSNLLNRFTKKKVEEKWFVAQMETAKGTRYTASTKANDISEAINKILIDTVEGCKLISIESK